ncbi:MAG: hypothetical protein A2017_16380 [Lentisphaerae bacterium GWF2_44_16]|nr:MAG: hypothetical protein A2017_16380 [Lentisphaerae bacterium GWF2_44_16]
MEKVKPELLEILVCPVDKAGLKEIEGGNKLECGVCGRRYPVREGIPVMLQDEAELPEKKGNGK